ncbi:MAG: mitochondrial fission ELM1 family protein [Candidatus Omnitrophica bacterium]|nr:mitochondrial fission ELM1 family protein [Candidatus Omnitrophota bacterium]
MPIKVSLFFARCLGTILYYLLAKRAKLAYLNLKLALEGHLSMERRRGIVKELFRNLSMNLIEFLYFPRINQRYVDKYIKIIGEDKIKKVLQRGKGLIFLTAHFGNWELSSLVAQIKGYPMVVLARQQKPHRLNELLNHYRGRLGAKVVVRGSFMRDILSSLRKNNIVGILGDQKSGKSGMLVELFSLLAWTPSGVVEISRHTGAGVLPVFIIREDGPYHRIEVGDELPIEKEDKYFLRQFHIILEKYIEKYPHQWLWFHHRWKGSPNRRIIILSDGKAGHLNQARALANMVREVWEERFAVLSDDQKNNLLEIREIEISFRNLFARYLINVLGFFARDNCRGCLRCLRVCLRKESYNQVVSLHGDIIISCGVNLSAVNLFLAEENRAKSIVIMKPGLVSLKRFDLAVIPFHDQPRKLRNIAVTHTALNLINEKTMEEGKKNLKEAGFILKNDRLKIGVLIGGETKNYTLTEEVIDKVIDELIGLTRIRGIELLVTTSRRTSPQIDNLIKKRLLGTSICPLLIIANEKNIEKAVGGILGLADVVVVSGESISMVSEALSSKKPVVVFEAEKKGLKIDTKQERFLGNLEACGYISLVSPAEVGEEIVSILQKPHIKDFFEDRAYLYGKIKNLIT